MQAKKIRVPGKLIELLRSDIPITDKRKYLDQLTIRYLIHVPSNLFNICIRLKLNDAYDYPTLKIIKEGDNPDEIFDTTGKSNILHMWKYISQQYLQSSWILGS